MFMFFKFMVNIYRYANEGERICLFLWYIIYTNILSLMILLIKQNDFLFIILFEDAKKTKISLEFD